jgi:hypothetical protein
MISDAPALEVGRLGDEAIALSAAGSSMGSRSRSSTWQMLFQMPNVTDLGADRGQRCAGCGVQIGGTAHGAATVCVFCAAWAKWRREGDEQWARVLSDQEEGGLSTAHAELVGLVAHT